jgi:hypothetical protein
MLLIYWKPVLLCGIAALIALLAYNAGQRDVQQDWDAERVTIAQALTANAVAQRDNEYAAQKHMNEVQRDASAKLESLAADAGIASAAADRMREQVGKLLAADGLRQASGTCASRTPAENPGNLLAVLLDKSIQRNRELAAFADAAMTAAQACEKARN